MENPTVTNKDVVEVQTFTNTIMELCPSRVAGSESCLKAADLIHKEFEENCDPKSVISEKIQFHGPSNVKIVKPAITCIYIGILFIFLGIPVIGIVCSLLTLWIVFSQIMLLWDHFDIFFKKRPGKNVIGEISPDEEVLQTVYLTAHYDAPYVYQVLAKFPNVYPFSTLSSVMLTILSLIIAIILIITPNLKITLNYILAISTVVQFPLMVFHWHFTSSEISPGGGDNLIAVGMINQIAKIISGDKKSGLNSLKHTKIRLIAFDAEESGLKGAKEYCKMHFSNKNPSKNENLRNIRVLNLDSFYYLKDLCVVDKDQNGLVQNSKEMNQKLVSIAHDLGYLQVCEKSFTFGTGAVDSARFSMIGIPATSIIGIHPDASTLKNKIYYHTAKDLVEHVEPGIIEATLKIILKYLFQIDKDCN